MKYALLAVVAACAPDGAPDCRALQPAATGISIDAAREAYRRAAERQELRYREAEDPGYTLRAATTLAVVARCPADVYEVGRLLFEHSFTGADGLALPFRRVEDREGRADAASCVNCHWRGGPGGAGGLPDNSYILGDGDHVSSADARNPPSLVGAGAIEALAAEMTADLAALRTAAIARALRTGSGQAVELLTKGISFGVLHVTAAGTLDTHDVSGIDRDLVVRPFGWKGTAATIEGFVADSALEHFGRSLGPRLGVALAVYVASLELPIAEPYATAGGVPYELEAWRRGRAMFDQVGCASCHTPTLVLNTPVLRIGDTALDLSRDAEAPRLTYDKAAGGYPVELFSDLKRHDLGEDNAAHHRQGGIGTRLYLTRRLWGLADSAPYFYDGEATTVDAAVARHGGDAAFARQEWNGLGEADRDALRLFLVSLRRSPRLQIP